MNNHLNPSPFGGHPTSRGIATPNVLATDATRDVVTGGTGNSMLNHLPPLAQHPATTPNLPLSSAMPSSGHQIGGAHTYTCPYPPHNPYTAHNHGSNFNPPYSIAPQDPGNLLNMPHNYFAGPAGNQGPAANLTQQQPQHMQTATTGLNIHLHGHHGPGIFGQIATSNFNMTQERGNQQMPSKHVRFGEAQTSAMQSTNAPTKPWEVNTIQSIAGSVGKPGSQSTHAEPLGITSKNTSTKLPTHTLPSVGEGIAALAGRGIHVPIKTKAGNKHAAEDNALMSEDEDDGTNHDQPKTKRPRGRKATKKEPESDSDSGIGDYVRDENKSIRLNIHASKQHDIMRAAAKKARKREKKKAPVINAIAAGTALPKTPRDAKLAAEKRHIALLADVGVTKTIIQKTTAKQTGVSNKIKGKGKGKGKTDTKSKDPDVMPEFFNKDKFPGGKRAGETVRCACGVTTDDGAAMVACDKCGVWQHSACMGDAVPTDLAAGKYACHMCDPFVHRVLLASMRMQNPL